MEKYRFKVTGNIAIHDMENIHIMPNYETDLHLLSQSCDCKPKIQVASEMEHPIKRWAGIKNIFRHNPLGGQHER